MAQGAAVSSLSKEVYLESQWIETSQISEHLMML